MHPYKTIVGYSEREVVNYIESDLQIETNQQTYKALIKYRNNNIFLNINIDLGGGFESGSETTSLLCYLKMNSNFNFTIRSQILLDKILLFFGKQNVITGYEEFDNNVIIKTNDEYKLLDIFEEPEIRSTLQSFKSGFILKLTKDKISKNKKQYSLEWIIDKGILDGRSLQKIYHVFVNLLNSLNNEY